MCSPHLHLFWLLLNKNITSRGSLLSNSMSHQKPALAKVNVKIMKQLFSRSHFVNLIHFCGALGDKVQHKHDFKYFRCALGFYIRILLALFVHYEAKSSQSSVNYFMFNLCSTNKLDLLWSIRRSRALAPSTGETEDLHRLSCVF